MFSISRFPRLGRDRMERRQERKSSSSRPRQLDRRNAAKNIDYDAVAVSWASTSSDESLGAGLRTRSLDLSPSAYSNQTSFRVEGVEEVDQLCRNLGLSGPEDFAIPAAAWEARKARSSSELLPSSRLLDHSPTASDAQTPPATTTTPPKQLSAEVKTDNEEIEKDLRLVSPNEDGVQDLRSPSVATGVTGGGQDLRSPRDGGRVKIKGVRPPPVISPRPPMPRLSPPKTLLPPLNLVLAPPPSMSQPVLDNHSSIWDILKSFAPEDDDGSEHKARRSIDCEEEDDDFEEEEEEEDDDFQKEEEEEEEVRVGETVTDLLGSTSFSTSNDDDSSSTTTETMFVISPNGRFKRIIKSWMRGGLLGSGSFGTVYEGISE